MLKDILIQKAKENEDFAIAAFGPIPDPISPGDNVFKVNAKIFNTNLAKAKEGTLPIALHNHLIGTGLRLLAGQSLTEIVRAQILGE